MRIKSKRELVLRAQGHARVDHIQQGTYGDATLNGHAEFKGCAIGCLATPHRKSELLRYLRTQRAQNGLVYGYDDVHGEMLHVALPSAGEMVQRLRSEFGINEGLARAAESVFEGLETHGAAIEFIPAFAKALPEGVDVTPAMVARWWNANVGTAEYDNYGDRAWSFSMGYGPPEEVAERFLGWLRSLSPTPIAA